MMDIRETLGWDSHIKPFLYKRLPPVTGWSAVLGTLCALCFLLMAATGMVLACYYVPAPEKAWDSVQYISRDMPAGGLVRGLHHWGAGAMVFLVFCHLMVTYLNGSYARPRQLTWVTGACLFLVTLGLGFTGYLLPWDMKAYWATVVGANIPSQYPVVGDALTRFILGGAEVSGFTLTRFYAAHTLVLPACLLLCLGVHIYLIRIHNLSDPRERLAGEPLPLVLPNRPGRPDQADRPEPEDAPYRFYPEHTARSSLAFGALFCLLLLLAVCAPPHMEDRAGTFIADYLPRPEWYYMWLFQLLTYFSGSWEMIGSLVLFGGGLFLLLSVPFFGESRLKGLRNRPLSLAIGATFLVSLVYLTLTAYDDAAPYNRTVLVPDAPLSEAARNGLFLYVQQECSYCHNILGRGGHRSGPDMSNMARKKRAPEYLAAYIKNPVSQLASSTMPDYALTDRELRDLAAFLLALDFRRAGARQLDCREILEQGPPSGARVPENDLTRRARQVVEDLLACAGLTGKKPAGH